MNPGEKHSSSPSGPAADPESALSEPFQDTLTDDLKIQTEDRFRQDLILSRRRRMQRRLLLNVLGVIIFLIIWEVAPRIVPGVNILMFPPPSDIVGTLWELVSVAIKSALE